MGIFNIKKTSNANKKAINFDLDTNKLYELTGSKTDGYRQIKGFLLDNGFEHKQWSGYISLNKMTYSDVYSLVRKMCDTFSWFHEVVNTFDVTRVEQKGKNFQDVIKRYGANKEKVQSSKVLNKEEKFTEETIMSPAMKKVMDDMKLQRAGHLGKAVSRSADRGRNKNKYDGFYSE